MSPWSADLHVYLVSLLGYLARRKFACLVTGLTFFSGH